MDILEMVEMASRFHIKKIDGSYEIESNKENIAALVSHDGKTSFFVTGVYNSGVDWAEIEMESLKELIQFCKMIKKQEEK